MRLEARILHFGRFDSDAYGGLERHVRLLLAGLKEHVQVDNLVAADALGGPPVEYRDGYVLYRAPSWGLLASTAVSPRLLTLARRLQREKHYDAIHLHFPDPLSHAASLLFPPTTKIVITWHSDIVKQERLLRLYRPFLDRILARADAIIAATPAHFASSTQLPREPIGGRLHVVPFGIDYAEFEPSARSLASAARIRRENGARPIVFGVGRHVYYKGFEYLIQAMAHVDAVLLLGGTGPLTTELQRLAAELPFPERVRFVGRIPDEDLAAYYHACDVFCLPSIERSEQFGLVQLEAMACGKPVLCCELGNGVNFVNQHGVTGLTVAPRDPHALAGAIRTLLADPALRAQMGESGRRRVRQEFSIDKMVDGTLRVYEKVLGRKGRPE